MGGSCVCQRPERGERGSEDYLAVNERRERQVIKDLGAPPPGVGVPVLALALVVEAVDLGWGSFVWQGGDGEVRHALTIAPLFIWRFPP